MTIVSRYTLLVAALAVVGSPGTAAWAAEQARFSLTPYAGVRLGGSLEDSESSSKYQLADSESYGLALSIPWEPNTELEFWLARQPTDIDLSSAGGPADARIDLDVFHLGGTVMLERRGPAVPYVVLTAGVTRVSSPEPGIRSDSFPSVSIGGGWQFFPDSRVGLRLEGRALGTFVDSSSRVFCGVAPSGSGCVIGLSGDLLLQFEVQAGAVFRF